MGRLTLEERQRVNHYRALAHAHAVPGGYGEGRVPGREPERRSPSRAIEAVAVAAVLALAFLAWQVLSFDLPASLVEALLPRV